nr:MAG TPA: hypothetical protein [Caudoviricetes sp.]
MGLDRTGSQPPRPPLPSPRTASTQQEPPHRCPQLDLPHRHPREHRPHQAAHTPGNSAHTLTRNTGGGGRGVSITPHHAGTPHQHAPGRHHDTGTPRPLQAPKTCATRTPPPGATGAHLSALQAHTQASNTHTADRPSAARTRTHSRTAATTMSITTSHHDTPKSAVTTKATKHQHKRTRAQPSQPVQHATL